jgi:DNA-binding SARP family transcriptional activator
MDRSLTTTPRSRIPAPERARELLEHFPFGILELDAEGRAHSWNPAAAGLLGDRLQPGASCCRLFGCRSGDGALARACLTDVVREAGAATPEIRVDLPGDGEHSGALWLTAAPLPDAGRGIVVQLRQGDRRDRRRRTDPHWVAGPQVRICALGRTEVSSGETQLGGRWLAQRPGQLLKYLVSQRTRSVLQDEIAYALWPENGYDAQSNVRHTMHQLRRRLEPRRANRAPSEFVVTREGAYSFARDRVTVDADEFEALARAGLAAVERDPPRARERLDAALELYRGDFLADEPYAEWALDERDRLRDLATGALHALAGMDAADGDLDAAYLHLRRLAELEPLDIHVQRDLLTVLLRRGRRSEASRRYDALWRRTMRELGQEPGFRLTDLADAVAETPADEESEAATADRRR